MSLYTLDGHTPVAAPDLATWGRWYEASDELRIVARTDLGGGTVVSTVFLGLDHRLHGDGPPLLFETMVFRGGHAHEQERYSTWDEAERGHAEMVLAEMGNSGTASGCGLSR